MVKRRWHRAWSIARDTFHRGRRDSARFMAAQLTFFAFISLIPLLLLTLSTIGFFLAGNTAREAEWVNRLSETIPGIADLIDRNLRATIETRATTGIIGLAGLVYVGVDVIQGAQHVLGQVFRTGEGGGPWVRRFRSYVLLAALGPVAIATAVGSALASQIGGSGVAGVLLATAGLLLGLVIDFAVFAVFYDAITPKPGPRFRDHLPGAAFGAVGWSVLKLVGALYTTRVVERATAIYGTFAAVIGIMVILHFAARLFVYGAELSAVLIERRRGTAGVL